MVLKGEFSAVSTMLIANKGQDKHDQEQEKNKAFLN